MSDNEDYGDFEDNIAEAIAEALENSPTKYKPDYLDDFHFRELVDMRNYLICQDHSVNDLSFKINNRKHKLNRRIKKGTVYGMV